MLKYKLLTISLFIIGTLIISSCSSKKKIVKLDSKTVKYGLIKGACFGTCPVYELSIYEGGKAVLQAKRFMDDLGTKEQMLSTKVYAEIEEAFAKSDFYSHPDEYKTMIQDLPSTTLIYNNGTTEKSVRCKEHIPEELLKLENLLVAVVNSDKWIMTEPQNESTKPSKPGSDLIKNQLIVQPTENEITEAWLGKYKANGLKLVKKLSPDLAYFLLEFNTNSITPDDMLAKIKADPYIRLAEFNKDLKQRSGRR